MLGSDSRASIATSPMHMGATRLDHPDACPWIARKFR